ncbi:MAG: hypothetical protein LPD71_04550 [Shewanella sp.]|nr:hypothetical protein [Shewanella sp.]MCF1431009.1 hypothetical protein [Shewanella sp.]MCF1438034.1 hypothetical protein [Shewanella sp.]MCF1458053.1 hypothetical protein [Shewanella sp.]
MQISHTGVTFYSNEISSIGRDIQIFSVDPKPSPTYPTPVDSPVNGGEARIVYERHHHSAQGAIRQYLHTQFSDKRDSISAMVGIDTYA